MATITLDYNPRNAMAQKTLDYILSLGIFKKKSIENTCNIDYWTTLSCEQQNDIELGISDITDGNVVDYDSFMSKHRP